MLRPLRILMVEDSPSDAELLLLELRRAGFDPEWKRVETEEDLVASLRPEIDIILSDFALPHFSGPHAIDVLHDQGFDIPFIIVSGTIGEETAVAAMKQGADDYLLKDRLARLGSAVNRALEKGRLRREGEQAQAALRESEERFRQLTENIEEVFWLAEVNPRKILYISPAYKTIWGRNCADLYSNPQSWLQAIHPDDRAAVREAVAVQDRGSYDKEYRIIRPDGSVRWIRDRGFPVVNAMGNVERVAGVAGDITARKESEARFREQAEMLDHAHDAIIVRDIQTRRITFWNHGAERLYGWTPAEAQGRDIGKLIFVDPAMPDTITEQLLRTGEWHGEFRQLTKAGKELIVSGNISLIRDPQGTPKSALDINIDLTEQKSLEAQFLRAQRMESIGTLASGVAHDLNNILAPIMMSAPLLRNDLPPELRNDILTAIETAAQRGADIVKQVLTFARGVEGTRALVQPVHLIKEMAAIAQQTFPKSITVRLYYPEQTWPVESDPTQIHQVLLNLCVNARDAMPNGGELVIAVDNFTIDEQFAGMIPDAKPGPYVIISVSDTGTGIEREIIDKIFDPFFTTKGPGKGTGLGLSTVIGIVKSHGGFVTVDSGARTGTTFKVYLPSPGGGAVAAVAPEEAALPRGRDELVLVVDDEKSICEVTKAMLEKYGYRVLVAGDGTEALSTFVQRTQEIDAVLTDVSMPFMDGIALARVLRKMRPHMPVLASCGGHCDAAREAQLKELGVSGVLRKPYTAEILLVALREMLDPAAEKSHAATGLG